MTKIFKSNDFEVEPYFGKDNESLLISYFRIFIRLMRTNSFILVISQEFILPFYFKKQIVFFHDTIQLSYSRKFKVYLYYKYYVLLMARRVLCNISPSESTRNNLMRYKIKSEVVYRIHDDEEYKVADSQDKKYHAVYVGTNARHKNIDAFIAAANHLRSKSFIIITPEYVARQIISKVGENIKIYSNLSKYEYDEILMQSKFFISPSYDEGYGPVWDGLRNGCKCILSDIDVYRELFGDVAIFFHPDDTTRLIALISNENSDKNNNYFEKINRISQKMQLSEKKLVNLVANLMQ